MLKQKASLCGQYFCLGSSCFYEATKGFCRMLLLLLMENCYRYLLCQTMFARMGVMSVFGSRTVDTNDQLYLILILSFEQILRQYAQKQSILVLNVQAMCSGLLVARRHFFSFASHVVIGEELSPKQSSHYKCFQISSFQCKISVLTTGHNAGTKEG